MIQIAQHSIYISLVLLLLTACTKSQVDSDTEQSPVEEVDAIEDLRLANFDPVSLYNVTRTKILKAQFPVIDLHSHPYANTKEDLDQWVKTLDEVGIDKAVIMT